MAFSLPAGPLRPHRHTLAARTPLHRIHGSVHAGTAFNPGGHGLLTRFAPFPNAVGVPVPYLYAAGSFECAVHETLFHDVSPGPALRAVADRTDRFDYTVIAFPTSLVLADLGSRALPHLQLTRSEVIDGPARDYPQTIELARRLWADNPDLHGLYWISRRDDRASCVLLFGDRCPPPVAIETHGTLAHAPDLLRRIRQEATAANIHFG